MYNLYYKIWIDAIVLKRAKSKKYKGWKAITFFLLTFLPGINLLVILIWSKPYLPESFSPFINLHFLHLGILDTFISGSITLFLPFAFLNYFLIIRNNRYGFLVKKHHNSRGKLLVGYMLFSYLLGVLLVTGVLDKLRP